jgi:hypothetical protein
MVARAKHSQGCLFCRRNDGGFRSREHIFSEALGNADYVLAPGIVCDRCNNGPLSRADEALIDLPPIRFLRAERGLPTKDRKAIVSKWGNATIFWSAPGTLNVANAGRQAMGTMPRNGERIPPGGAKMNLVHPPIADDRVRNATRSIWKSALELIYWDCGPDVAFQDVLDPAREAIIRPGNPRGWLIILKHVERHDSVELEYALPPQFGARLPVRMNVFGIQFMTDALCRDVDASEIRPPIPANVWTF